MQAKLTAGTNKCLAALCSKKAVLNVSIANMIHEIIKIIKLSTDDAYHSYNKVFVTTTKHLLPAHFLCISAQFLLFKTKFET